MSLPTLTAELLSGQVLPDSACALAVASLLDPEVADTPKSEFLTAQMQRGLVQSELVAFATAILKRARSPGFSHQWHGLDLMDCCGTGGGGLNILNVSTGLVFILTAAGIPMVKHGNRGVTKKSGSADVLEALGLRIDLDPPLLQQSLQDLGWGFVFAPHYHPSFKAIAGVRKTLGSQGRRTIFNYLGPLLNPVRPNTQLMGVFDRTHLELYAQSLLEMGCPKRCIVFAEHEKLGPLGEACFNPSFLHQPVFHPSDWTAEATREMIEELSLSPAIGGEGPARYQELIVDGAEESARRLESIYRGESRHQGRGLIIANAAVALCLYGTCPSIREGIELATFLIDSKAAYKLLERSREWAKSQK